MEAKVGIVGKPNVGKSTLFNRLIGKNLAIVDKQPGITRDINCSLCEWEEYKFTLIDTGGLDIIDDEISKLVCDKIKQVINEASLILLVLDGQKPLLYLDQEIISILRKVNKKVIVVINKIDNFEEKSLFNLGLGEEIPISALHGLNINFLLDKIVFYLFEGKEIKESSIDKEIWKIAVVGKPNVGKSSLLNCLIGKKQLIVHHQPGTTRDAIDVEIIKDDKKFVFIDTAGIRRKKQENIEKYSIIRTFRSIKRADICLLIIDAKEGITSQDIKIIEYLEKEGKAVIIIINKWDLINEKKQTFNFYKQEIENRISFIKPIIFFPISVLENKGIPKIFEKIKEVMNSYSKRISTSSLNKIISKINPKSKAGKQIKIFYIVQTGIKPPLFILFVKHPELVDKEYLRYVKNIILKNFGFVSSPIKIVAKGKSNNLLKPPVR